MNIITEFKMNPALEKAIAEAKTKKPSQEEIRQQRVSFICGSLGESSTTTRDRIQNVLNAQEGKVAD